LAYLFLLAGFAMLIVAGDALVRGATALALRFAIPPMIIGLTVVAFGTSAPELMISVRAALDGAPGIAIGNVVGSNIANVLLVLGLPAIFRATHCREPHIRRNTVYMVAATLLFIALCFNGPLGFWQGLILFGLVLAFLVTSTRSAGAIRAVSDTEPEEVPPPDGVKAMPHSRGVIAAFLVAGLAGLPVGAELVVRGASEIARGLGVGEAAIGLTLVAVGTSLPELATTLMAAIRGQGGIAIGNVIGSNMFNILAIMGLTSMVATVPVPAEILRVDLWVMLAAALVIVPYAFREATITRGPATVLVLAYAAYVAFVFATQIETPGIAAAGTATEANP
jgi:cation:H+ antiporter